MSLLGAPRQLGWRERNATPVLSPWDCTKDMAKEAKQGLWAQTQTVRKQASREDMGNKPDDLAQTPGPPEHSWWMMTTHQTENKQGVVGR